MLEKLGIVEKLGLPMLASEHGAQVDLLIGWLHVLMIGLFVGWSIYFAYVLWRFRRSRGVHSQYAGAQTHATSYIEVGVAAFEVVLLIGLALPYWSQAVEKFPDPKTSTVLRVIGRQFNWIAHYPGADGVFAQQDPRLISSTNQLGLLVKDPARAAEDPAGQDDVIVESSEMAVPVNKPVIAHISSLDVIHSFKVTPLRITQDATPGMSVPIHFKPTVTNTYQVQCSQLCGNSHYAMRGLFRVLPEADYNQWIASKTASSRAAPASYE
jgi:cytochrome c oxidase subunit 2